jgi:hypothetical protein
MVKLFIKIPSMIIRFLIIGYQKIISPALPGVCRFYPSCSEYALDAVSTHGALLGTLKAAYRLLRCHPLNSGGFDPVCPIDKKMPPQNADI